MLLTKDDAAQKWCPLARSEYDSACKCIADGCAVWRWTPITNPSNGARRFREADNPAAETEHEAATKPEHCHGWEFCPCAEDPAGWVEPQAEADLSKGGEDGNHYRHPPGLLGIGADQRRLELAGIRGSG